MTRWEHVFKYVFHILERHWSMPTGPACQALRRCQYLESLKRCLEEAVGEILGVLEEKWMKMVRMVRLC